MKQHSSFIFLFLLLPLLLCLSACTETEQADPELISPFVGASEKLDAAYIWEAIDAIHDLGCTDGGSFQFIHDGENVRPIIYDATYDNCKVTFPDKLCGSTGYVTLTLHGYVEVVHDVDRLLHWTGSLSISEDISRQCTIDWTRDTTLPSDSGDYPSWGDFCGNEFSEFEDFVDSLMDRQLSCEDSP